MNPKNPETSRRKSMNKMTILRVLFDMEALPWLRAALHIPSCPRMT
jgi:hypothetical protein